MDAMSAGVEIEQLHRLSTDDSHKLIEAGVFDEDARLELIDGYREVVEHPADGRVVAAGVGERELGGRADARRFFFNVKLRTVF